MGKPAGSGEYEPGPAFEESYGFRESSFTHSAAERTRASAVASLRCRADAVMETISPPRIAAKAMPTMTTVIRISTRENPLSSASFSPARTDHHPIVTNEVPVTVRFCAMTAETRMFAPPLPSVTSVDAGA